MREELQQYISCKFEEGVLKVTSADSIEALPAELLKLVNKRIELKFRHMDVEKRKSSRYSEAAATMNALQITYQDVVCCFVDEIVLVVGGTFFLDSCKSCAAAKEEA